MKIIFLASFVILAVSAAAHTNDINNQRIIYPSDYQAQRIYPTNSQAQRRWFGDEEEETDFRRRNVSKVTTEHTYVHEERPKEVEDTNWGLYFFGTIGFIVVFGLLGGFVGLGVASLENNGRRSLPLFDLEMLDMLESALTNIPKMTEDFQ